MNKHTRKEPRPMLAHKAVVAAVALACAQQALAIGFETESGWKGSLNTTITASGAWRVQGMDKALVGPRDAMVTGLYQDATAIAAGCIPGPAMAYCGTLGGGTYNAAWLRAAQAGWRGGAQTDAYNINYDRGDMYSRQLKVLSEVSVSKEDMGALIRVKGWYDDAQKNNNVRLGNASSKYIPNQPLGDGGAKEFNTFDGLELLDAYAYKTFDIAGRTTQIRLGRQAINWGESIFVQGVNQLSPLDVTALRKAGTEIKEALLPVWSLYANMSLPEGTSLEGFYQLKWEGNNLDQCGTYFGGSSGTLSNKAGDCNFGFPFSRDNASAYNYGAYAAAAGKTYRPGAGVLGYYNNDPIGLITKDGPAPKDSGQWGLAFRFPVDALDTEFGLYAMNIHSRMPVLTIHEGGTFGLLGVSSAFSGIGNYLAQNGLGIRSAAAELIPQTTGRWTYPEDMKVYGLSAATTLAGVSVGAELSYTSHLAIQRNGNDVIAAAVLGVGPDAAKYSAHRGAGTADGTDVATWDFTNKTQFQINGITTLPSMLGAVSGLIVGEAGFQWAGIDNATASNTRYGRSFIFGAAPAVGYGAGANECRDPSAMTSGGTVKGKDINTFYTNPQPQGCQIDGFMTNFAWGYRLKASLDYPLIFGTSWIMTPSIYWAHDVAGQSVDYQFNKGRKTLALGLTFNLNKEHVIGMTYTTYANSAKYDAFRDHDNASLVYTYTF